MAKTATMAVHPTATGANRRPSHLYARDLRFFSDASAVSAGSPCRRSAPFAVASFGLSADSIANLNGPPAWTSLHISIYR